MAYLVLVRHGQSEWNALGKWTGWSDVSLSERGRAEAKLAAEHLREITLHKAYTSDLKRAQQTLEEIQSALGTTLETTHHPDLNERDYGDLTGMNKWELKDKLGEAEFNSIRRAWNHPIAGGETLKDVHARATKYYEKHILADLRAGHNVIVAAHGNSLRALAKDLEGIADEDISGLEMGTGEVFIYEIDERGKVLSKEVRGGVKDTGPQA